MAAPALDLDPVTGMFSALAQYRRLEFKSANLRIGTSRIVHAVSFAPWTGSLTHPAPSCHQGWSGFGLGADLHPTRRPVSCRKCLSGDVPGQLAFDLVGA